MNSPVFLCLLCVGGGRPLLTILAGFPCPRVVWMNGQEDGAHLLGEGAGNLFRVAVDSVEQPGETETKNGSQEEHAKDDTLLDRGNIIHVGTDHVSNAQDQEEEESWRGEREDKKTTNISAGTATYSRHGYFIVRPVRQIMQ